MSYKLKLHRPYELTPHQQLSIKRSVCVIVLPFSFFKDSFCFLVRYEFVQYPGDVLQHVSQEGFKMSRDRLCTTGSGSSA